MKNKILLFALLSLGFNAKSQLYSSGNNLITGTNVGIGTNAPIYTLESRKNANTDWCIRTTNAAGTSRTAFRMQNEDSTLGQLDFVKFGKNYGGTFMGISRNNMGGINSLTGPFVLNSGSRMILGTSLITAPFTQTQRIYIDSFGKIFIGATTDNIGIGTTSITPVDKLHLNSTTSSTNFRITNSTSGHTANDGFQLASSGNNLNLLNKENGTLSFGTNNTTRMAISATGNITIGTTSTPAGYKLFVEQGILTEKVKVAIKTSANWADYVFADNYELKPLAEVENFINAHKHLPGIPSANEVVATGIDLATMDAKLLEKIEELTLHLIRMEKEIDQLKKENQQLQSHTSTIIK